MLSYNSSKSSRRFEVRWQAQRDTALDQIVANHDPKRRRRNAATPAGLPRWGPRPLPAHFKLVLVLLLLTAHCSLLTGCRRDMQDQPKAIAYRENSFYKDGTGSRPLVEGTVPRGYLRADRELYLGKKMTAAPQTGPLVTQPAGGQATAPQVQLPTAP